LKFRTAAFPLAQPYGIKPELPDFSWYIKPKWGKCTKLTTKYTQSPLNTPNGLKIPNGHKIYRNVLSQGLQKYVDQNWNFWFENIQSIWQP
jgi:hypothetical protein